jgi:hypothetical protein
MEQIETWKPLFAAAVPGRAEAVIIKSPKSQVTQQKQGVNRKYEASSYLDDRLIGLWVQVIYC